MNTLSFPHIMLSACAGSAVIILVYCVYIVAFHLYVWICPHCLFYKDVKWIQASSTLKASLSLNSGCFSTLRRILFFLGFFSPLHTDHRSHVVTPRNKHGSRRCAERAVQQESWCHILLTSIFNLHPSQHISGGSARLKRAPYRLQETCNESRALSWAKDTAIPQKSVT